MNSRRAAVVAVIILILLASALFCVRSYNERFHESEGQSEIGLLVGEQLTEDGFPNESSRLWVYGNANEDDVIDDADVSYLLGVLSGDNPETVLVTKTKIPRYQCYLFRIQSGLNCRCRSYRKHQYPNPWKS